MLDALCARATDVFNEMLAVNTLNERGLDIFYGIHSTLFATYDKQVHVRAGISTLFVGANG
jgi:hypothetical protein